MPANLNAFIPKHTETDLEPKLNLPTGKLCGGFSWLGAGHALVAECFKIGIVARRSPPCHNNWVHGGDHRATLLQSPADLLVSWSVTGWKRWKPIGLPPVLFMGPNLGLKRLVEILTPLLTVACKPLKPVQACFLTLCCQIELDLYASPDRFRWMFHIYYVREYAIVHTFLFSSKRLDQCILKTKGLRLLNS